MLKQTLSYSILVVLLSLTTCASMPFASTGSGGLSETIQYNQATLQDLKRVTEDGLSKDWISISPDGNMLLYCESIPVVGTNNISNERIKTFQIMLLRDAEKPAKTHLVMDNSITPAWFSNDTFVYSVIERGVPKLIKSNIAGGGKVYITRNPVGAYDVRPTVRGNLILCDTEINRKRQIIRMRDNGADITTMCEGESPSWHPRNPQKFVFIQNGNIFEMDLNTYQATRLFGEANFKCANPHYSYDGNFILFQKEAQVQTVDSKSGKAKETTHWHAFVVRVDGTDLVQLTDGAVDVFSPVWSSKNNRIFFVSNANNSTEIWTARVNLNYWTR